MPGMEAISTPDPAARRRSPLVLLALAACLALAALAPAAAQASPAVALGDDSLTTFDTGNPGAAGAPLAVTGLTAGATLVGTDFRPQNGFRYGLGFGGGPAGSVQLYLISLRTGQATAVGTRASFEAPVAGTSFGFDFNPTVDRV